MILTLVPGGRGEDSSVIITLPECSDFTDIPEEALTKVLTYLTLIPRCVGITIMKICITKIVAIAILLHINFQYISNIL